ncbi:AJAP1 protein, partial [Semnornis frantzii]|nr:AJAP1 protein [Semnornis frantzii]
LCPSNEVLSAHRSGCPLGSHAWILIAMFHLAMDLASCQPAPSGTGGRLSPRPTLRHRLSRASLWGTGSGEDLRRPGHPWNCTPPVHRRDPWLSRLAAVCPLPSWIHSWSSPTGTPGSGQAVAACWELACSRVGSSSHRQPQKLAVPGMFCTDAEMPLRGLCVAVVVGTLLPAAQDPPRFLCPLPLIFPSTGLAVHQIITITVSLIMVIAALITTLVLKNCCAQSGRPRRNSHQRKLDQQEESCQNLTDFAPARVPSALDIFTAYNETLQCSHECVRTPVPVYAEEALRSPGDYKTTFNGNRPSSSDRHLIPVAFVSEKWFEISC